MAASKDLFQNKSMNGLTDSVHLMQEINII